MTIASDNDLIQECLHSTGVEATTSQFEDAFCVRCLNGGCKRSSLNLLKWSRRMERQENALYDPVFGDPNSPEFIQHARQKFQTLNTPTIVRGTWDSFGDVPKHKEVAKETPKIHKAEAPITNHDGQKLKAATSLLAQAKGKDVSSPPVVEVVVEAQVTPRAPAPTRPVSQAVVQPYNTSVPASGLLLKAPQEVLKPIAARSSADLWGVQPPKGKKEKLVVRASDGKVLNKK